VILVGVKVGWSWVVINPVRTTGCSAPLQWDSCKQFRYPNGGVTGVDGHEMLLVGKLPVATIAHFWASSHRPRCFQMIAGFIWYLERRVADNMADLGRERHEV
jgi:hypothetical protein